MQNYTKTRCAPYTGDLNAPDHNDPEKPPVAVLKAFLSEPDGSKAPTTQELGAMMKGDKEGFRWAKLEALNAYRKDAGLPALVAQ